ncbi:MFS transporter [Pleomorphomonas sp. NRK KF1]|uniref:MFS transporter n=1 Tax=Pleomorphomonas sp. NRK KF1 TaxID=2943000 RepID=UPI0020448AEC|nr:MFS transporter [Pleomorphomonas sp. NRK KF1]MCM5551862.1 MFS transporter [Pleomorphomonas sp. NRK KF1]
MNSPSSGRWSELFAPAYLAASLTLMLAAAIFAFNAFLVSTAMPTAVGELHGEAYLSWTLTVYIVASITAGASAPLLKARFGARRCLFVASGVFALGTLAAALSPSMELVLVGRAVQGAGEGLVAAVAFALIPQLFPSQLVGKLFGAEAIVWAAAAFGGPVLAGIITEFVSWRAAFLINLPIVAMFLVLVHMAVPQDVRDHDAGLFPGLRLGLVALGMMAISVAAVALEEPWQAALVVVGAAICLTVAVRIDLSARVSILPRGAFGLASVPGLGLWTIFLLPLAQSVTGVFLVYAVQHLWGYGPAIAGGIGAILAVAWSTGAVIVANYDGTGKRLAFVAIGASVVTAGLIIGLSSMTQQLLSLVMLGQLVTGLGMGVAWGSLCQVVMETHPESERDKASALLPTLQSAGYAAGSAVFGLVGNLAGFATDRSPEGLRFAMIVAFAAAVLLALPPLALTLRMGRLHKAGPAS